MQRILVCDDDGGTARTLRVILRDAGFRVQAAASANEALDAAPLRAPAAAIVELALPDAHGVDLCRQLREWSAIPLIVLSAIDEENHYKVRAVNAAADDYVTKPFAPRELVTRARTTLRARSR
jgi:two-component system KDP operon response regulator KdpE